MDVKTESYCAVSRRSACVPLTMFHSIFVLGALAGTLGMKKLVNVPPMATSNTKMPTTEGGKPATDVPKI